MDECLIWGRQLNMSILTENQDQQFLKLRVSACVWQSSNAILEFSLYLCLISDFSRCGQYSATSIENWFVGLAKWKLMLSQRKVVNPNRSYETSYEAVVKEPNLIHSQT